MPRADVVSAAPSISGGGLGFTGTGGLGLRVR
jgi:hypothetical protein